MNHDPVAVAMEKIEHAAEANRISKMAVENLRRWLTQPQYQPYRGAIIEMVESSEFSRLDRLFWEVIRFGTGGRRGPMGELGSATMNDRTVAESAHGLAVYWKQTRPNSNAAGSAVVACDTRNRSPEFSRLTARTLAAHGLKVFFFESFRSTPLLSFAVRHLKCDVGVMISASHNPPSDNGFKAYWSNGGQVLDPHDAGIIECVYNAEFIPVIDFDQAVAEGKIVIVGEELDRTYHRAVVDLSLSDGRDVSAIYTPLHGVGETSVFPVLKLAGFEDVEIFQPQREPNGNFPNVPDHLPNPERPQVFSAAIERAKQTGASLVLASDPDADRLGAAARDSGGEFVHLSGNRIGVLLTDYILRKRAANNSLSPAHYIVETLVTSPLIASIGRSHNVRVIDDLLVGFKYIGQTMDEQGPGRFVFGCEESLGYLAGQYARDKDASIAALYLMELAADLRRNGRTLLDRLDELYIEHGYHFESQRSKVCEGPSGRRQIDGLMQAFRDSPPEALAGFHLERVRDYEAHEIRSLPDQNRLAELPEPRGELLFFESSRENLRAQFAVRPSGTEPKIKFYFFFQSPCDSANDLGAVRAQTDGAAGQFADALEIWLDETLRSIEGAD